MPITLHGISYNNDDFGLSITKPIVHVVFHFTCIQIVLITKNYPKIVLRKSEFPFNKGIKQKCFCNVFIIFYVCNFKRDFVRSTPTMKATLSHLNGD